MGLYTYITITQDENVTFDDLDKLHADFDDWGSPKELLGNLEGTVVDRFITQTPAGATVLAGIDEHMFTGWEVGPIEVWGCFEKDSIDVVAKHMTGGKLVFMQDVEGHKNKFYVCTPGNVQVIDAGSMKF